MHQNTVQLHSTILLNRKTQEYNSDTVGNTVLSGFSSKEKKKIKDHASSSRWIYISSYKLFYLLKSIFIFSFIFPTSYFLFCLMVTGDSNFPLPVSFWLLEMYFLVRLFSLMCFSYFSSPVASAFSYYNPILFPHRSQIVLVCIFSVFL